MDIDEDVWNILSNLNDEKVSSNLLNSNKAQEECCNCPQSITNLNKHNLVDEIRNCKGNNTKKDKDRTRRIFKDKNERKTQGDFVNVELIVLRKRRKPSDKKPNRSKEIKAERCFTCKKMRRTTVHKIFQNDPDKRICNTCYIANITERQIKEEGVKCIDCRGRK